MTTSKRNRHLSAPEEERPDYRFDVRTYDEGDIVLCAGQEVSNFYVILDGSVKVTRDGRKIRVLGEQDVFGMECLVEPHFPYTVQAVTAARIAIYDVEAVDYFIATTPRMARTILLSVVKQLVDTGAVVFEDREVQLPQDVEIRFFGDGERVVHEGSQGREFFRLVSADGGLRVTRGGLEVGRIDRPGTFFGAMACLLRLPWKASVTSVGESTVQVFPADRLLSFAREFPDLAVGLIQRLSSRLVEMNRNLIAKGHPENEWDDLL
jgi:CRP-like cAMP-binding protein